MTNTLTGQILLIAVLTLINAFFSGAEMAIVSIDKKKLRKKAKGGNKKAALLLKVLKEPSKFLSTIQVGITFAGFFSSASAAVGLSDDLGRLLTAIGLPYGPNLAFIGVTLVLSYIMLVAGELVPKRIALQHSEKFAMFAIGPIHLFSKLMTPFVAFLSISTNFILRILGIKSEGVEEKVTLEEIKSLVEVGHEQGVINPVEKEMLTSVISFDDKVAVEVMTARTQVYMIDVEDPIESYLNTMLEQKHTRIPIYQKDIDHIIGLLHIKDFILAAYQVGFGRVDLRKIMRSPYFVPENKNINTLFLEMQASHQHFAILIDEYGGFSGIVTMEDLIEEIMGDIEDEYDPQDSSLEKLDDSTYLAKGFISIADLNSALNLKLDQNSEFYDTLAGLLLYLLGYIPKNEDRTEIDHLGLRFTIQEIKDRKIKRVKIQLPEITSKTD